MGGGLLHATRPLRMRIDFGDDDSSQGNKGSLQPAVVKKSAAVAPTTTVALQEEEAAHTTPKDEASTNAVSDTAVSPSTTTALADMSYEDKLIALAEQRELDIIAENNAKLPKPIHPSTLIPEYKRVKKHAKLYKMDEEYGLIAKKEDYVPLPPPQMHPWVDNQPIGPHIVHGDGQQRIVGSGEVGFDEGKHWKEYPTHWRGFKHFTTIGLTPTNANGFVLQDTVIKHSLPLTGRGLFATRDIQPGENIMVVRSVAVNLGFNSEIDRLCEMTRDLLLRAKSQGPAGITYLHEWILTCQLSGVVERWPNEATDKIMEMIGGPSVLEELELHAHHIAHVAAVVEMNSYLVESHFAEKKGMGFWPEASALNHSCCPNADYDIIPSHRFAESGYCKVNMTEETGDLDDMTPESSAHMSADPAGPSEVVAVKYGADNEDPQFYTPYGAHGKYLFCCKANRLIKAGEEILVAYVPPSWRYEDRQYVLHDRYRFWCRCPLCSAPVETYFKQLPRFMIGVVLFYFVTQLTVYKLRADSEDSWAKAMKGVDATTTNSEIFEKEHAPEQ